jgi:hypothetical protein
MDMRVLLRRALATDACQQTTAWDLHLTLSLATAAGSASLRPGDDHIEVPRRSRTAYEPLARPAGRSVSFVGHHDIWGLTPGSESVEGMVGDDQLSLAE